MFMPEWFNKKSGKCACCKLDYKPVKRYEIYVRNIPKAIYFCFTCAEKLEIL